MNKHKFTAYNDGISRYGLSEVNTLLGFDDIKYVISVLDKFKSEREHQKLYNILNRALLENLIILHDDGSEGSLRHDFILCKEIPSVIEYKDFSNKSVKIQDQFILENHDVFSKVKFYWNDLENQDYGFNYYGITIINPEMAKQLIGTMIDYIKYNPSEKAEYFLGEEYNTLSALLTKAILNNESVNHYGI